MAYGKLLLVLNHRLLSIANCGQSRFVVNLGLWQIAVFVKLQFDLDCVCGISRFVVDFCLWLLAVYGISQFVDVDCGLW